MQIITELKFLKLIPFHKFSLWDVKRYTIDQIQSDFALVPLSRLIQEENQKYKIYEEPEKEFKILGVSNVDGLFDAYTIKGKDINQPYKKVKIDWLAYNPYRINVGSIGLRDVQHKNEYISPAYVVFSCNDKLLPDFLYKIFKTETFNRIIRENTTGSVRQNLLFNNLETLEIPLPLKEEQQRLLNVYYKKINKAIELEADAINLYRGLELNIFKELGIKIINKENKKGIQLRSFKNITRWDTLSLLNSTEFISNYQTIKLGKVINSFMKKRNGESIRFESYKNPNDEYIYLGMEFVEKNTGEVNTFQIIKGSELKSQSLFIPKGYWIYGKLRPYLNKYWFNETNYSNLICSSEFFVFSIKEDININYFKFIIGSSIIQQQITNNTSGARMPRINEDLFLNLFIPLPSKEIQDKIAIKIIETNNKIKQNKVEAIQHRKEAIKEFEESIFNK